MENEVITPGTPDIPSSTNVTPETQSSDNSITPGIDDLSIQNKALQDLLQENKATMQALKDELTQVKTANAKLVAQLDISKSTQSVDDIINSNFNRYFKK